MQLTRSKSNIVEKVLRDANGRLVRATFCVYECGGHIKARLLNVEYIKEYRKIDDRKILIDSIIRNTEKCKEIVYDEKVSSPYFTLNTLYFSGSKPRAPTK